MPYQLASDAPVNLRIYNVRGQLVRELDLGLRKTGSYKAQESAAYWDGRDQFGEAVSSGIYFYTLRAGAFQATRRMLILK
jgi:flagellar hook assembly protein FlgD